MIGTGWEIWGIKSSMLLITIFTGLVALIVRLMPSQENKLAHVDGMAGDEGDD